MTSPQLVRLARPISLFLALFIGAGQVPAVTAVPPMYDDAGRPKVLSYSAKRVVALAPSLTELVFAAGGQSQLVGVSAYSNFPEAATFMPLVADSAGVSFEALLALKPDLVLAWKGGTRPVDLARIESLGMNVFVIGVNTLADVPRAIRTIGKLLGRPLPSDKPEQFAARFESRLEELESAAKGKAPLRVFFEISQMPLMTVNGKHFISETMRLCGGENVFANVAEMVIEPSRESLLKRGADVILRPASIQKDVARDKTLYAGLAAYRNGRIYPLNADWILRPGPRVLLATEEVCAALDLARASMAEAGKVRP